MQGQKLYDKRAAAKARMTPAKWNARSASGRNNFMYMGGVTVSTGTRDAG